MVSHISKVTCTRIKYNIGEVKQTKYPGSLGTYLTTPLSYSKPAIVTLETRVGNIKKPKIVVK